MDVDPFSLTLLEEKVYAYFVVRKMAVRKKKVLISIQQHYESYLWYNCEYQYVCINRSHLHCISQCQGHRVKDGRTVSLHPLAGPWNPGPPELGRLPETVPTQNQTVPSANPHTLQVLRICHKRYLNKILMVFFEKYLKFTGIHVTSNLKNQYFVSVQGQGEPAHLSLQTFCPDTARSREKSISLSMSRPCERTG